MELDVDTDFRVEKVMRLIFYALAAWLYISDYDVLYKITWCFLFFLILRWYYK